MRDDGSTERARRIGIAGLSCECCTFSPLSTREDDFAILRGDELRVAYEFIPRPPDAELVPLLGARALPGGSIDRSFYERIKAELLEVLVRRGPWDGLLLTMHGAAHVVGMEDAEGDLLASIREAVGPGCLISASYDLHGNVSRRVMRNLDLLTAYRTAPHVDTKETVRRAGTLLVEALRRASPPVRAFLRVPVLLPGEQTSTEWDPGARLYAAIPEIIERYGIQDASLLIGYVWADEPRASASVVVFGEQPERVNEAARVLARMVWDARREFRFGTEAASVNDCLRRAAESSVRPVLISDSGDNPSAGGAGDVPCVLEALLACGATDTLFASIADAAAVAQCRQVGVGTQLRVSLGGKLDPIHGDPLTVRAEVLSIHAISPPPGTSAGSAQSVVVLRVGGVDVIVTERRTPFHQIVDFERLGVDPRAYRVIVVKIGYLEPELKRLAARSLLALSPGAVNQDLESLVFERIRRPMFPLDPDMLWEPPDRNLI
jgi:microcystin degradation protein MlrC